MNILLCTCEHFHAVPEDKVAAVRSALESVDGTVEEVGDLCGLAARHDSRLASLASQERSAVVACYPRAVRWLFAAAGAALNDGRTKLVNMHEQAPEAIARSLSSPASPQARPDEARPAPAPTAEAHQIAPDWKPWFPVLDYDRCADCGQCMNFCLFGVFELDGEDRVVVVRPENCKTNCPACARVCPQAAIMFPKHPEASINGDQAGPDAGGVAQVDISEALGPNLYATLRNRGKGVRFASKDARAKAEAERQRCATLRAIREKLGITPEVIESIMADCGPDCECHDSAPEACGDEGPGQCNCGNCQE